MKTVIFILLFLLSGCTNFNQWSTLDRGMYIASWGLVAIDVGQTRYSYNHPDKYEEECTTITNFFDNKKQATLYLIGINAGIGLIADKLIPTWRTVLLTSNTVGKGIVIFNNNKIGIGWEW